MTSQATAAAQSLCIVPRVPYQLHVGTVPQSTLKSTASAQLLCIGPHGLHPETCLALLGLNSSRSRPGLASPQIQAFQGVRLPPGLRTRLQGPLKSPVCSWPPPPKASSWFRPGPTFKVTFVSFCQFGAMASNAAPQTLNGDSIRHFSKALSSVLRGDYDYQWVKTIDAVSRVRSSRRHGELTINNLPAVLLNNPRFRESVWNDENYIQAVKR